MPVAEGFIVVVPQDRVGVVLDSRLGPGQPIGLAEAGRIGRDAGEVARPLPHQRLVFGRGTRALVGHQQGRAGAAALAIMDPAGPCGGDDIDVMARDRGGHKLSGHFCSTSR